MMYLSGAKNPAIVADLAAGTIGFLRTPYGGHRLDDVAVWAMDNGCFTGAYPGDEAYLALLDQLETHRARCLFVAVPDVVGDGPATLAQFPAMAARIHARGWPVALVGQDGMEHLPVPWDTPGFSWLFVGGSTEWKLGRGAIDLIRQAQAHGKRVHVGRVNSGKRFARFASLGCDTADGTYLAFGPETNAPKLRGWLRAASHPTIFRSPMEATA